MLRALTVVVVLVSVVACGDDDVVARDASPGLDATGLDARVSDLGPSELDAATRDARVDPETGPAIDASADADTPLDAGADVGVEPDAGGTYDDLVIRGVGFDADDGATLYAEYEDTSIGRISERLTALITGGRWEVSWPRGFSRDLFGVFLYVFMDTNGDMACSSEAAFSFFVSNDFTMGPLTVEVTPADGSDVPCSRFE